MQRLYEIYELFRLKPHVFSIREKAWGFVFLGIEGFVYSLIRFKMPSKARPPISVKRPSNTIHRIGFAA
ncbi:MAG: hypothetical protein AB8B69_05785 [Chitinophagales bacterium]